MERGLRSRNEREAARAFARSSGLVFEQGDGRQPRMLLAAQAPGEHGISLIRCRFDNGLRARGTGLEHMVYLTLQSEGETACRVGDKRLDHVVPKGNVTVSPAGADVAADGEGGCEGLILIVPRESLAVAAVGRARPGAAPVERLRERDPLLLHLGLGLARQAAAAALDEPLAWCEQTDAIIDRLIERHLSAPPAAQRGRLEGLALARVIECMHERLDATLCVDELADVAVTSRSHFPRLFRRAVGCSPYRYVIRLRLERALVLLRAGGLSLAEVALQSGFADQSHLTRWMQRSYGASPGELLRRLH